MCTMNKNNFAHYFVKLYNKQTAIDTVTLTHSLVLLGANYVLHKRRSKKKLARHTPTSSLLLLPQCLHGLFRFFLRFHPNAAHFARENVYAGVHCYRPIHDNKDQVKQ